MVCGARRALGFGEFLPGRATRASTHVARGVVWPWVGGRAKERRRREGVGCDTQVEASLCLRPPFLPASSPRPMRARGMIMRPLAVSLPVRAASSSAQRAPRRPIALSLLLRESCGAALGRATSLSLSLSMPSLSRASVRLHGRPTSRAGLPLGPRRERAEGEERGRAGLKSRAEQERERTRRSCREWFFLRVAFAFVTPTGVVRDDDDDDGWFKYCCGSGSGYECGSRVGL
jgi:hypothetical protein